jgi:Flp pilus assembly protein TadB
VSATLLTAGLAGTLVAVGLLLIALGLTPQPTPPPGSVRSTRRWWRHPSDGSSAGAPAGGWRVWRWPVAAAVGLAGWALSGLPVAAPVLAVATLGVPVVLGATGQARADLTRAEALGEWTRRLGDILAVGVGLEQAIVTSTRTVPAPLAAPVGRLAARLQARWDTAVALRVFADELSDPTADLVVAALLLAQRRRGPGLAAALTGIATSVAEEVAARRRVEADRAKPRTTARWVTVVTLATLLMAATNTDYLTPYGTGVGQLVLALLALLYGVALWWMHRMATGPRPPRLLASGAGAR